MEETPVQNTQPTSPAPVVAHKRFSPRTLILIIILAIVAGILIYFAISMGSQKPTMMPNTTDTSTSQVSPTAMVEKTATVAFSPTNINMAASSSSTVDIIVTAGNTPITAAQVEITYDPNVVKNARILPPDSDNSLFGASGTYLQLFNETSTPGVIKYGIGAQANGNPVIGAGSIGKLTFSVVKGSSPSTQVTFGDETAVTIKGVDQSVLNSTTPLTITLQ